MNAASSFHDDRGLAAERAEFVEAAANRIEPLLRLALALVETPHAAEALVEQVLSVGIERAHHLGGRSLTVWLSQRCVQLALRQARATDAPEGQPVDAPGRRPGPSSPAAGDASSEEEFRRHIARLPLEARAALLLRELEGLSYAEIAHALASDIEAAKLLVHRARLALVEALEAATRRLDPD